MNFPDLDGVPDCVFCQIVRGERDADIVYETDDTLAFFPLTPAVIGHTLVVPKRHVQDLWASDRVLASHLIHAAIDVGKAIDEALNPEGMNLIASAGEAASQSVFHLHLHVVPRWRGDPLGKIWPETAAAPKAQRRQVADLIRGASHVRP